MKRSFFPIFVAALATVLAGSCLSFPRRAVSISRASDEEVRNLGGRLRVGTIEVTRRTFAAEIQRDLESLLPSFSLGEATTAGEVRVDMEVVEREVMRDFSQSYAAMIVMRFASPDKPDEPIVSIIMTLESKDSVASPYVLKRYVEDCLRMARAELEAADRAR